MIINSVDKDVTIKGNTNVQNMTMKVDEKAFSILIDKLYSRKKEAIVRELCSNASDAHVEAGICDIPYDLILPSLFSSELIVRDYGNGLSKDDVIYYLGTLFGSKSANSNDAIGGFGLGAKSPFCLVDSYHITSYHKGMKHHFFYVRENGGIPKFVHLDSSTSDEKSGIKFTVNVGEENIRDWAVITASALSMFDVKPNCNIDIEYPKSEILFDTVEVITSHRSRQGLLACMGGVVYPIDKTLSDIITVDSSYDRLSHNNRNIIMRFDIGELDVAPSRETLEYTSRTIININRKIDKLNKSVDYINEKLVETMNSQLRLIPITELLNNPPISLFRVPYYYSMFTDEELEQYPLIVEIYGNKRNMYFGYVCGDHMKHIIKTRGNEGLSNSPRIIINNTSHSYKLVSEQIPEANIVKIPSKIDNDTALFVLNRICEYKFGVNNYTIEYFKDLYVKPSSDKPVSSSSLYLSGVRDIYGDRVRKEAVDFSNDGIIYMVKDVRGPEYNNYYQADLVSLVSHVDKKTITGNDDDVVHKLVVTPNAVDRLKLKTNKNAISILKYIDRLLSNDKFIIELAKYVAYTETTRYERNYKVRTTYEFPRSTLSILSKNINTIIEEDNLSIFKTELINARVSLIEYNFDADRIDILDYVKSSYNRCTAIIELLLDDAVTSKQSVIKNIHTSVNEYTVQQMISVLA